MALSPKGPQGEGSEYVLVADIPHEDPALSHGAPLSAPIPAVSAPAVAAEPHSQIAGASAADFRPGPSSGSVPDTTPPASTPASQTFRPLAPLPAYPSSYQGTAPYAPWGYPYPAQTPAGYLPYPALPVAGLSPYPAQSTTGDESYPVHPLSGYPPYPPSLGAGYLSHPAQPWTSTTGTTPQTPVVPAVPHGQVARRLDFGTPSAQVPSSSQSAGLGPLTSAQEATTPTVAPSRTAPKTAYIEAVRTTAAPQQETSAPIGAAPYPGFPGPDPRFIQLPPHYYIPYDPEHPRPLVDQTAIPSAQEVERKIWEGLEKFKEELGRKRERTSLLDKESPFSPEILALADPDFKTLTLVISRA